MKRKKLIAISVIVVLAGVGAGGYWFAQPYLDKMPSLAAVQQALPTLHEIPLSNEQAAELIKAALDQRPVVVRLALGDVIAIDREGNSIPLYLKLSQAGYVSLRFCHFPGAGGTANQICVASLTEKAEPFVYSGTTPLKVLSSETSDFNPPNRSVAQLAVARPARVDVTRIADTQRGKKLVSYRAQFELTPLASFWGIQPQAAPPVEGTAEFRETHSVWTVEKDGLP
jgi:hypothetical protein